MDEMAEIRIRIRFSKNLDKSIDKARKSGEKVTRESIINGLVDVYRKTLNRDKSFLKPLLALDKHVKVTVESLMVGE